jgi:hypothetical protein
MAKPNPILIAGAGVLAVGIYAAYSKRKQLLEAMEREGRGRAADFLAYTKTNPDDVVASSMLAYELGLRPTAFLSGYGGDAWLEQNDVACYSGFGAFDKNQTLKDIRQARASLREGQGAIDKAARVHRVIQNLTRKGLFKGGKGKGVVLRTLIPFKKKVRKAESKLWRKVKGVDRQLTSADKKLADIQSSLKALPPIPFSGFGELSSPPERSSRISAMGVAQFLAPWTLYPWLLKQVQPEWGYGRRVLIGFGVDFAARIMLRGLRTA